MAAKKTTKKDAPVKVEKTDLSQMSAADLHKFIADKRADMLAYRRSHRAGELINPRALTATRKEIARALTALGAQPKEEK